MWAYRKTIRVQEVGDAKEDITTAQHLPGFLTAVVTKSLVEGSPYIIHFYFQDVGQGARWAQDLKRVWLGTETLQDWGFASIPRT